MNGSAALTQDIQDQLAQQGSFLSSDEIEEILQTLRNVSLKLIVTNVPREVYTNNLAQEAFENLFKPLDPHATFLYLPSFNRAQVYTNKPEAALCARLQIQGWKLPDSILAQIPSEARGSTCHEGINCFIDHMELGPEDESESEGASDVEDCTCNILFNQLISETHTEPMETLSKQSGGPLEENRDLSKAHPPPVTVEAAASLDSIGDQNSWCKSDRRIRTPEGENTSEASGDDVSEFPVPLSRARGLCTVCGKRKRQRTKPKMHHLAPPKPPRLFLLSPPCSPPVGWEPKPECEPVINYDLLEALASLTPGESFELHPSDREHKHPSIVITPCESSTDGPRPQIIHTRCPERKI